MNDKTPTKSLMKRLEARIKKIKYGVSDDAFVKIYMDIYKKHHPGPLASEAKKTKKAKGGLVRKK